MRSVQVHLYEILDLANAAGCYGFDDAVLMCSLGEWTAPVTDDEIKAYAQQLAAKPNYDKEDEDEAIATLTEWRDQYA